VEKPDQDLSQDLIQKPRTVFSKREMVGGASYGINPFKERFSRGKTPLYLDAGRGGFKKAL
jgi:hypothetical protein